jgi:hypothetical protein
VVAVLVDGPAPEADFLRIGRTAAQAPEIDGLVCPSDARRPRSNSGSSMIRNVTSSCVSITMARSWMAWGS